MNWNTFIPLLITASITVVGWFILHRLSRQRDQDNKRKDLRIQYIIEAWRKLGYLAHRDKVNLIEHLEKPIADIQLFGTFKQIKLAQKVADEMAMNHSAEMDELLADLRQDLRKELNLEVVPRKIKHLRIIYKEEKKSPTQIKH